MLLLSFGFYVLLRSLCNCVVMVGFIRGFVWVVCVMIGFGGVILCLYVLLVLGEVFLGGRCSL
jgi:hypothetical protein